MENGNIKSTNPYNFTFGFPAKSRIADQFINGPYRIYFYGTYLLPWLILHSLNNVNLVLMKDIDLRRALLNMNITRWSNEHAMMSHGILTGGLGDSVWLLVALLLLAVSAVYSYIANKKKTRRESHFASFAESLWIHAADILKNSVACAKKVAVPLRHTRAWWLLGVTFVLQFWCAGLQSDLLVDDFLLIDSLEDLTSNPEIICYFTPTSRFIKLFESEDSKYTNLRQQLRRNGERYWEFNDKATEKFASGKAVVIVEGSATQRPALFEKLKRNERKLYVGKTKIEELYVHMFFNKRLPRDIKERIDYV